MEFGTFSFTILEGYKKVFRLPKNTHTNNFGGYKKVFRPLPTPTVVNISWNLALSVLQFWGSIKKFLNPQKHTLTIFGGIKKVLDPPKHTLTIFGGIKSF